MTIDSPEKNEGDEKDKDILMEPEVNKELELTPQQNHDALKYTYTSNTKQSKQSISSRYPQRSPSLRSTLSTPRPQGKLHFNYSASKSRPSPSSSVISKYHSPSWHNSFTSLTPRPKSASHFSTSSVHRSPSQLDHSLLRSVSRANLPNRKILSNEKKISIQKMRESLRNVAKKISNHDEYAKQLIDDEDFDISEAPKDSGTPSSHATPLYSPIPQKSKNTLSTPSVQFISSPVPNSTPSRCPLPPTSALRRSARVAARKNQKNK